MIKYFILGLIPSLFISCFSLNGHIDTSFNSDVQCVIDEFNSNNQFIISQGMGESLDPVISKKKALSYARTDLLSLLKIKMEAVVDAYILSMKLEDTNLVKERFNGLQREVVKEAIISMKIICEKLTKTKYDKFKTHILINLSYQILFDKFENSILKDSFLNSIHHEEKFKKCFENEIQK